VKPTRKGRRPRKKTHLARSRIHSGAGRNFTVNRRKAKLSIEPKAYGQMFGGCGGAHTGGHGRKLFNE